MLTNDPNHHSETYHCPIQYQQNINNNYRWKMSWVGSILAWELSDRCLFLIKNDSKSSALNICFQMGVCVGFFYPQLRVYKGLKLVRCLSVEPAICLGLLAIFCLREDNPRLYRLPGINLLCYTQRNLIEILLNQTEIRLYLPFSDWFGTENGRCPLAVPNQSVHGKYNPLSGWFNKISKKILCASFVGNFAKGKHSTPPPEKWVSDS